MYQLHIGEEANGQGITRLDIGPYYFPAGAAAGQIPGSRDQRDDPAGLGRRSAGITDEAGASWLRWQGGRHCPEDGEMLFQMTSNYPPSQHRCGPVRLARQARPGALRIAAPDYSQPPPQINPRHDVKGQKRSRRAAAVRRSLACSRPRRRPPAPPLDFHRHTHD